MLYVFGDYELDTGTLELRRDGVPVKVEPQVFDVLVLLVRNRDRVVTKEELLDAVWGDRFVSDSALTSRMKAARKAVGDDGRSQRCIRTSHGRGYRFVLPVEEVAADPGVATGDTAGVTGGAVTVGAAPLPPVRYAQCDGLNIAYQVSGGGPTDLVLIAGFVSHLTLDWTEPRHAHFLHRLGSFSRLLRFDKRGTGMSDRPGDLPDLEARMGDVGAVMAAAGSERAVLFGYSEGGPMAVLYAATYPERVCGLVLYGSYARRLRGPDYPWAATPEERLRYSEDIEREWAFEAGLRQMCPNADEAMARWFGERCRAAASPGAARKLIEMNSLVDVTDLLGSVKAPTLVLHRRHDSDSLVEEGRFLAEHIPGARFVELDGADHFVAVDADQIVDQVEPFVRELGPAARTDWSLTTLLAVRLDERVDRAWVRSLADPLVREHRGEPAERVGTTVVATFDGPSRAVRCALALLERLAAANLHTAVGLHIAEVTRRGGEVDGAGTATVTEVAARAAAGEVVVTGTLRDLLGGAGYRFEPRAEVASGPEGRRLELAAVSPA